MTTTPSDVICTSEGSAPARRRAAGERTRLDALRASRMAARNDAKGVLWKMGRGAAVPPALDVLDLPNRPVASCCRVVAHRDSLAFSQCPKFRRAYANSFVMHRSEADDLHKRMSKQIAQRPKRRNNKDRLDRLRIMFNALRRAPSAEGQAKRSGSGPDSSDRAARGRRATLQCERG